MYLASLSLKPGGLAQQCVAMRILPDSASETEAVGIHFSGQFTCLVDCHFKGILS